ncbi:hypothetical protein H311_01478, partial [Anncaliia algerae PRA109]
MDGREQNISRITSFIERITTFKCMKVFVIIGIGIKTIFICANVAILLYKRNEKCRV